MSEIAGAGVRPAWRGRLGAGAARPAGRQTPGGAAAGLAGVWLLDAVLQYQSVMFTRAFGQMLAATAPGNPGVIARPITWDATLIEHHAVR